MLKADKINRANMYHHIKFRGYRSNRCWDIDLTVIHQIVFLGIHILTVNTVHVVHRRSIHSMYSSSTVYITVPNFVLIGQTIVEIWLFFNFSRWWPSTILDF